MVVVGLCTLELFLGEAGSLKDKRRIIKSMVDRIRGRYNVSVAEVEQLDLWQRGTIAVSCVSNDRSRVDQLLSAVVKFVENQGTVQITDYQTEIF